MDWQTYTMNALLWSTKNVPLFMLAAAGAVSAYMLYAFPEAKRLGRVLRGMFPTMAPHAAARWNFVLIILIGTFVTTLILQPTTSKEAFLSGFAWLGVLRHMSPITEAPAKENAS